MKRSYIFFVLPVVLGVAACSGSKPMLSKPVVTMALPNSEDGTIIVRSSGTGPSENEAVLNSERKAFSTLMFYGLPSSVQGRPMVEDEAASRRQHAGFYQNFFDNNAYRSFITNAANYSAVEKAGKMYYLTRDIKINLQALRSHLEANGIIRKFGY